MAALLRAGALLAGACCLIAATVSDDSFNLVIVSLLLILARLHALASTPSPDKYASASAADVGFGVMALVVIGVASWHEDVAMWIVGALATGSALIWEVTTHRMRRLGSRQRRLELRENAR